MDQWPPVATATAQPMGAQVIQGPGFAVPARTTLETIDQPAGVQQHPGFTPPQAQAPAPPPAMPPEIAAAIVAVCLSVKRLRHDGLNTTPGANYRFTSVDDFLESVGAWCAEAGLVILPEEVRAQVVEGPPKLNRQGQWETKPVLWSVYRFYLVHQSGAMWAFPMHRRVAVHFTGPQSFGSAESYALKRFMRSLFKVPTGDAMDLESDSVDPDALPQNQRMAAPVQPQGNAAAGDLWGAPTNQDPRAGLWGQEVPKPAHARVTGRVAPARRGPGEPISGPPGYSVQGQGFPGPVLEHQQNPAPPPPPPGPSGGETPFRVWNGMGEVVAEYRDLKTWGEGLKRHLSRFPSAYATNQPELERLADHFLADPTLTDKARKGLEAAFTGLRGMDPAKAPPAADTGTPQQGDGTTEQQDTHPMAAREPGEEG